ncbi:MAG: glycosyltransferase family 1 protein [Cytophagales bacterium]|nr:glycosyltransferase family 1 protein [Cytophagales bacterium]
MKESLQGKKILFTTLPADGHFNPLTGLAKYLQAAGADVRWYTSPLFKGKLEKLNIRHYPFWEALDTNGQNLDEHFPGRKSIADPVEKLNLDMINGLVNRSPEYYADIRTIRDAFPFDLVVADSLFPAIPFVKRKMGVPVVAVGVVPLAENSVDLAPYGMARVPAADEEQRTQYATLRDFAQNVLFKPSIDAFDAMLGKYGMEVPKSVPFDLLIKEADLYLQIGTPGFEYPRTDLGDNVRFVGALLPYAQGPEPPVWFEERLREYQKIVLVTQGTVEKDVRKMLEPTLTAFRHTDVLVVASTGGSGTEELRSRYGAENVIIEDFIPFDRVMPYASVFVTNGGYGGTLLSIKNRLPLVAAGVHEGKNEVCARIGYFGIGIDLGTETPTPEAIRDGVETVLADVTYRENITRLAGEFATYPGEERCAGYIAELLEANHLPHPYPAP